MEKAKKTLQFQAISWSFTDIENDEEYQEFLIKVYGVTAEKKTVSVNIKGFTPYFYVSIPPFMLKDGTKMIKTYMQTFIEQKLIKGTSYDNTIYYLNIVKRKDFWGFKNNQEFDFIQIIFHNFTTYKHFMNIFYRTIKRFGPYKDVKFTLYESNIEPYLRFMHIRNISPSGWIEIRDYTENQSLLQTNSDYCLECYWKYTTGIDKDKIASLSILSFDLECSSSHGDFPVACKDYKKMSYELLQGFLTKKIDSNNIYKELQGIFDGTSKILSNVYPKGGQITNYSFMEKTVNKHIDEICSILKGRVTAEEHEKEVFKDGCRKKEKFYLYVSANEQMSKDEIMFTLTCKLNELLPPLEGDKIIQIGMTKHYYGDSQVSERYILTLGTCDDIDGAVVVQCETESELLLKWRDLFLKINPDVVTGYNILGFDFSYIYDRAKELNVENKVCRIGRVIDEVCPFIQKTLSSSALGDNILKYIDMSGRVIIDIMKIVQRDHKLDSYKLDNVANYFLKMNKHDVAPNDIFRLQKGNASDRKKIAEYCIQDCELCNRLIIKLEIIANNIGMSNVCSVPLSYIFMRGQGIKIFSLVAKQCREDKFLIPVVSQTMIQREKEEKLKEKKKKKNEEGEDESEADEEEDDDDDGYEGAIVLPPKEGVYLEDPISVLDYASLYPSSMISENLSHDCIVLDEKYNNLPGKDYLDIEFDIYKKIDGVKQKTGVKTCRFVQNEKGIIPRILMKLLMARKNTRKKIEYETVTSKSGEVFVGLVSHDNKIYTIKNIKGEVFTVDENNVENISPTYDDFEKAVLDGLQLAYKITANSLYGQVGARTSPIYLKEIAACTTATGRKMIMLARDYILDNYTGSEIVYGDTDSIMVKFRCLDKEGNEVKRKDAIPISRELGIHASKSIKKLLKPPHDLEWEKLFWPFILFSKKRYCANKYEHDDNKYKMTSMGIALKRRDNAPIVKHVYGGIIDIILNKQDIVQSVKFLKESLENLVKGEYPMEDLIITKSLRADYKDPNRIAHKVLAERMGERDPGNKPQVNDRIPYVYVEVKNTNKRQKLLQGDMIEHPDYIRQNDLKPDYSFYITNQIMKPIVQLYALALDDLPDYKNKVNFTLVERKLMREKNGDIKKVKDRLNKLKEAEIQKLYFDPVVRKCEMIRNKNQSIMNFFKPV